MRVPKLLISPVKKRIFCSKTTKFSPKLAFLSIVGSFGALLVGWLKVVPHGLYLSRHLFTLLLTIQTRKMSLEVALLLISYVCELFFCYSRFVVLVLEDTGFEMRRWIQILIRLQFLCPLPHT